MMNIGYEKTHIRLIKIKHRIAFRPGNSKKILMIC